MSKQMKILVGVLGVVVLAMVVLTMFGKPPNLPLGPLQGMLAKDDTTVVDDTTVIDAGGAGLGGTSAQLCDPVTGMPIDAGAGAAAGAGTTTDPLAGGAGTTTDPAAGGAGTTTDPLAGGAGTTTDPAAGATGTTTDPASSAPVAAGADGWTDGSRVVAAGDGYDSGRVPDTWVAAADASTTGTTDPTATGTTDPAATGAAGTTGTDPAATGATGTDPAATGTTTDPAATGGAASGGVPCDQVGAGTGTGAGAGAGAAGGTGAGAAGGAGGAAAGAGRSTTDGTNSGNNPEALRAAKDATAVMQKANITVSSTATLVPGTGGIGRPAALKRYRSTVTSATIVIKLDDAAMTEWTGAGKKVQISLVKSFLTRMRKSYPKSARSITITDAQGNVLAIGDASVGGTSGTVKLL